MNEWVSEWMNKNNSVCSWSSIDQPIGDPIGPLTPIGAYLWMLRLCSTIYKIQKANKFFCVCEREREREGVEMGQQTTITFTWILIDSSRKKKNERIKEEKFWQLHFESVSSNVAVGGGGDDVLPCNFMLARTLNRGKIYSR